MTQAPSLLIMAAGLGSRFGGVKQLAVVGPAGEAILDYSIRDARAAGFGPIVVIVRSEIEDDVRAHLSEVHGPDVDIRFVRQDELGPPRSKPWGTLHAIVSAAEALDRPFAVINADDYYGAGSFTQAAADLARSGAGHATNIAFDLGNTVPPQGSVTRGLCSVVDGRLSTIVETEACERRADGTLWAGGRQVADDTPASMNIWTFHHSALDDFAERWRAFLAARGDDPKAECQLPTVVAELMAEGRLVVEVTSSTEQWIGITNPDDLELARTALARR